MYVYTYVYDTHINMLCRCCLAIEEYRVINDLIAYMKSVTGRNIMSTLSLIDIKKYIQSKYLSYCNGTNQDKQFFLTNYIGLQQGIEMVFVVNAEVSTLIFPKPPKAIV